MALSPPIKEMVEEKLQRYCDKKVPVHFRNEIRMSFFIRDNFVTLFEERSSFLDPLSWSKTAVAQFRYDPKHQEWTLYCLDRNERWREYDMEPSKDLDVLIREIEKDSTGIFWG